MILCKGSYHPFVCAYCPKITFSLFLMIYHLPIEKYFFCLFSRESELHKLILMTISLPDH